MKTLFLFCSFYFCMQSSHAQFFLGLTELEVRNKVSYKIDKNVISQNTKLLTYFDEEQHATVVVYFEGSLVEKVMKAPMNDAALVMTRETLNKICTKISQDMWKCDRYCVSLEYSTTLGRHVFLDKKYILKVS